MSARRHRFGAAVGAVLSLLEPAAHADEMVKMGVRADARPFSWRAAPGEPYKGFVVDLCRAALARIGLSADAVEVTAANRFAALEDGTADLLCDPTTLTLARAQRFAFSPIVFIANASFAAHHGVALGGACPSGGEGLRFGYVAGSTASLAAEHARMAGAFGRDAGGDGLCPPILAESHAEAVALFCGRRLDAYFGDIEIVRAHIAQEDGCDARIDARFATYEPYALAIGAERPDLSRRFSAAVYSLFADGEVDALFARYFGDAAKSPALEMLFRINRVPPGEGFIRSK